MSGGRKPYYSASLQGGKYAEKAVVVRTGGFEPAADLIKTKCSTTELCSRIGSRQKAKHEDKKGAITVSLQKLYDPCLRNSLSSDKRYETKTCALLFVQNQPLY